MDTKENKYIAFVTSPKGLTILVSLIAVTLAAYILISTQAAKYSQQQGLLVPTPVSQMADQANQKKDPYAKPNPALITSVLAFKKNINSVDVTVDTGKVSISGAQIAIAYNPKALTNVSVTPGSFFNGAMVLESSIDTIKGTITYVLSIRPNYAQEYGTGTLATIHYTVVPGTATTLSFLPDTKITALGINGSLLKKSNPIALP